MNVIYELFGLPGSGKTTICKEIEKKYNVCYINRFYKENIIGKIYFHIFLKFFKTNKNIRDKYDLCLKQLSNYKTNKNIINAKLQIELYLKYIMFVYFIETKNKNQEKKCIIDEGIIHYLMALYAEFNIPVEILEKILNILNISKINLGLKCNLEVICYQIKVRNRKNTPIDFLNDEDLKIILNKYNEAFNYFLQKFVGLYKDEMLNFFYEESIQ